MELREAVGRRQFLDLRRERNARAFDDTEKIGVPVNVCATGRQNAENQCNEK